MPERRSPRGLRGQVTLLWPLVAVWAVGTATLGLAGVQDRTPLDRLFLDANFLGNQPWYTGALSDLGVLGWTVGVVAGAGGAWIARLAGRAAAASFLASGAAATSVLLADDLFQLHAVVLGDRGVAKPVAQLLVILPAIVWLGMFVGEILRTRWLVLLAALCALAGSVVVDAAWDPIGPAGLMLEDGAKLLGILAWALYLVLTTADILRSVVPHRSPGRADAGSPAVPGPVSGPVEGRPRP